MQQVWLADDAIGAGGAKGLRNWWEEVIEAGSRYGYYVNETKSSMILKRGSKLLQAQTMFNKNQHKIYH